MQISQHLIKITILNLQIEVVVRESEVDILENFPIYFSR